MTSTPFASRARTLSSAGMLLMLGAMHGAQAQITPIPRGGDVIAHRVVDGDTLEQLAARYLGDHRQWQQLQSHNRVADPYRLRPGSVLEIPVRLLRAAVASVEFVQGEARASRALDHLADTPATASTPAVQTLRQGQTLREGDRLQLAPDAFVSVRLADGSLVRVQSQSDVLLRQMRRKGRAGTLQSVLDLQVGGIEASVPPEAGATQRRLEVRTPVASTSVRGTHFLVQAGADGSTTAVDQGAVAVASAPQPQGALLRPGQGVAVAADGRLADVRDMLPAPDIRDWPAVAEDANWVSLPLPALPGAARYQVLLARDAELAQVLRSASFSASPLRLAGVEDGDYVLSIRGVDDTGIAGHPSRHALRVKAHPEPPLYESPSENAAVALGREGLRCTQVVSAAHYRIQVAEAKEPATDAFATPAIDADGLRECALPAQSLARLPAGRYLWRAASVRTLADGRADQGPFAAPQALRLAPAPSQPAADALQLGDSQGEGSRSIRWKGEAGQRYRIQVAGEPGFAAPLADQWLDAPQWSTADLPAGSYYLRLQIEDSNGLRSDFSAARLFKTGRWITDGSGQMLQSGSGERLQRQ